ncbi:MAG TPA: hypothetical protein VKB51_09785 [bacterium]|nr:hypothetical protein [bacterium]
MNVAARAAGLLLLLAVLLPAAIQGAELEQGINQAAIINFPTALNQPTTHMLHTTLELTDIGKPELNLYNVRYGFQHGAFQLINDLNFAIEPLHEFDYAEVKAKLQVLSLDEYRSYVALGLLGRAVRHADERQARIDDKPASLFVVSTFEIFPFQNWGGFLFNVYLDNRFLTLGTKVQLYQSIQFVGEVEHLHSTLRKDKTNARAGVSFEGLQNFYFQLLWTDQGKHLLAQVGAGF